MVTVKLIVCVTVYTQYNDHLVRYTETVNLWAPATVTYWVLAYKDQKVSFFERECYKQERTIRCSLLYYTHMFA